jgi:hypothetical protein
MEHPLISNIDHLSMEELQSRISDLIKKLSFAQRSGNAQLANQLRMALESFNNKYQQRVAELNKPRDGNTPDYSDRIDIS